MAAFKVNGKNVCSEKNQKLLRFLRDELRLTSVKDGCSEGACGACTVIIDGKTYGFSERKRNYNCRGADRMGTSGMYLCIWKGRGSTVWILHSWNGNVYESTS